MPSWLWGRARVFRRFVCQCFRMAARASLALALAACALAGCGGGGSEAREPESPSWNHNPADTSSGPSGWGALDVSYEQCLEGERQSPINIARAVPDQLPPLEFNYAAGPLVVENTGHTVEVAMPDQSANELTIGKDVYRLAQYHFHAPSEHTLDGERYDAEVHLVHEDAGGRLAVVGVFLDESRPPSPLVDSVIANAPEAAGEETDAGQQASAAALVPRAGSGAAKPLTVSRYYTYSGSLTTPDCKENVRWVVLEETLGVSPTSTELLHELISGFPGYAGYANNNRPTQPLNGRRVVRSDDG
jgi:carbonic anhydrase